MDFRETNLKNAYVINLAPYTDERGYFTRLYCKAELKAIGFDKEIVQINHSLNKQKHTLRGFHYQVPPYCETKIIRCVEGSILDIIIDIRKNSETFLKSFSVELSEDNFKMMVVPEGFAHGYITLEENTSLLYLHTNFYKPGFYDGLRYDDPALNINLPVEPKIISVKDQSWPSINESGFSGLYIRPNDVKKKFRQKVIH